MSDFQVNVLFPANTVVGVTKVLLSISRTQESNLGNLMTDSMVDWVGSLFLSF